MSNDNGSEKRRRVLRLLTLVVLSSYTALLAYLGARFTYLPTGLTGRQAFAENQPTFSLALVLFLLFLWLTGQLRR